MSKIITIIIVFIVISVLVGVLNTKNKKRAVIERQYNKYEVIYKTGRVDTIIAAQYYERYEQWVFTGKRNIISRVSLFNAESVREIK